MNDFPEEVWIQLLINLSRYIDGKISVSGRHSVQVAFWVKSIAQKLNLDELDTKAAFWASLLHDIGKIGVPEDVLEKNGPLTGDEWSIMRLHPTVGANMVTSLKSLSHIAPLIHYHQEKYDGSGYPKGLHGDEIPLGARILAVVDAYDSMINDRVYRKACSHTEALDELRAMGGQHFDPQVVDAFVEILNNNPDQ